MTIRLKPYGGQAAPRGATVLDGGVNFSVYSEAATAIWVSIFDDADCELGRFLLDGRDRYVWFGLIEGVDAGTRYGLRADGPYDPAQGFYFDPAKLLVDPYAKLVDRKFVYDTCLSLPREVAEDTAMIVPKALVVAPLNDQLRPSGEKPELIYELNVRGFSKQRPRVASALQGTVAGLADPDILAHLTHLGVDVVQLMPTAAWIDERHLVPLGLRNAWGYNPVIYFAPDPRLMPNGLVELRELTALYRAHGISVILDVVYNHTGEGDAAGSVLSMRGLDPLTYYRHVPVDGRQELVNDTGTGNTLRCDHPEVQRLVIDSLRHWVEAAGVAGFRFDLAPILGRSLDGFDPQAELLEKIKADPVLSQCLLIAEPWDPGPGGYHLGAFGDPFLEHNDTYRDEVRAFWRGDAGKLGALASKVSGSSNVFNREDRWPSAGVNFLAVHDGFTLMDLVSYADKHNAANGEDNRDGHNHNLSWNNGVEGETDDAAIQVARERDVRALLATLFLSRGTPMIQQGDEMGRTQHGNNNAYAQDNELAWVDWDAANKGLIDFVADLSAFRQAHPAIVADQFLVGDEVSPPDVVWLRVDGQEMTEADWHQADASIVGMHLRIDGDEVLVWFNRGWEGIDVVCPAGGDWEIGFASFGEVVPLETKGCFSLPARSVVAFVN